MWYVTSNVFFDKVVELVGGWSDNINGASPSSFPNYSFIAQSKLQELYTYNKVWLNWIVMSNE